MTTITTTGLRVAHNLEKAGLTDLHGDRDEVLGILSLIARHAKTYRELEMNLTGWKMSGEYVNANWDRLQARVQQLETRLEKLGRELRVWALTGSPVVSLNGLYGVSIIITDSKGISRERDAEGQDL
jgi:hypothetical protein